MEARKFEHETASSWCPDERAAGVIESIKSELRIPFVPDYFRALSQWPNYLQSAWEAVSPAVGTTLFEGNADQLRWLATTIIGDEFGTSLPSDMLHSVDLTPPESAQVVRTLETFEYLLPRLLLLDTALSESFEGRPVGQGYIHPEEELSAVRVEDFTDAPTPISEENATVDVYPILMRAKEITASEYAPDELLALARCPTCLCFAWKDIEPLICSEPFLDRSAELARIAVNAARDFPCPVELSAQKLREVGISERELPEISRLLQNSTRALAWRTVALAGFRWALENRRADY